MILVFLFGVEALGAGPYQGYVLCWDKLDEVIQESFTTPDSCASSSETDCGTMRWLLEMAELETQSNELGYTVLRASNDQDIYRATLRPNGVLSVERRRFRPSRRLKSGRPPAHVVVPDWDDGWANTEKAALRSTLSMLRKKDRRAISGLRFERRKVSRHGLGGEYLRYPEPTVVIYDAAFGPCDITYEGTVERPRPPGSTTMLHEIGHALGYGDLAAKRQGRAKRVVGESVHDAFRAALGELPGPTAKSTTVKESFAESFALFYMDPEALRQIRPALFDFFQEEVHTTLLNVGIR